MKKQLYKKNYYILTRFLIFFSLIRKRKATLKKIWNTAHCFIAYLFKSKTSGKYPFLISFELTNHCNAHCIFCRNEKGDIFDQNPQKKDSFVPRGTMSLDLYKEVIKEAKDHLLMATLYINGEPLLYPKLPEAVAWATQHNVATMLATNGTLLDEDYAQRLLKAGLNFIKISLSGYTQDVHKVQVRHGNVDQVKENIRQFARLNKEGGYGAVILIDFMVYPYNEDHLPLIQRFCKESGLLLNVRHGNPRNLPMDSPQFEFDKAAYNIPCDWLWKTLSLNWNGDLLPCCDYVTWTDIEPLANYKVGQSRVDDIWNSDQAKHLRHLHATKGRSTIPICARCDRKGIAFKL